MNNKIQVDIVKILDTINEKIDDHNKEQIKFREDYKVDRLLIEQHAQRLDKMDTLIESLQGMMLRNIKHTEENERKYLDLVSDKNTITSKVDISSKDIDDIKKVIEATKIKIDTTVFWFKRFAVFVSILFTGIGTFLTLGVKKYIQDISKEVRSEEVAEMVVSQIESKYDLKVYANK